MACSGFEPGAAESRAYPHLIFFLPTSVFFSFIFGLFKQTSLQFLQQIYVKMSIQYTVQGFEPTTFGT